MAEIPYVKEEHFTLALYMEKKLLAAPNTGILFAGVSVTPTTVEEDPEYRVWVGCSRDMSEETVGYAVHFLLREEILKGAHIKDVQVHRGTVRG